MKKSEVKSHGLLVLFDLESVKKDELFDGIINWISLRMRRSIKDYSTNLHSLVLLQAKSEDEFAISDTEDLDILNASIEIERHLQSIDSNDCVEKEEKENGRPQKEKVTKIQPDVTDHKIGSRVCPTSSESKEKDYSPQENRETADSLMMTQTPAESVIADAGEVEHGLHIDPEMERNDVATTSNTSNQNVLGNYTLLEDLPAVKEDDLISGRDT